MQHRPLSHLPAENYPPDPWRLIERGFVPERLAVSESLFALANGYLGIRGSLEESEPGHEPGTFINGIYETWPINYPEDAFGLPELGQSILVLPDATPIVLYVDGEPFRLTRGRLIAHERVLDMEAGLLRRRIEWESPTGTRVRIHTARLVSFLDRNMAAFRFEVELLAGSGPLTVVSQLVHRHGVARPAHRGETADPRDARDLSAALLTEFMEARDQGVLRGLRTRRSGMRIVCGIDHRLEADHPVEVRTRGEDGTVEYVLDASPGSAMRLEKFAVYCASEEDGRAQLASLTTAALDRGVAGGFDAIRAVQQEYLAGFWQRADVVVEGDPATQQAVRWNLFQLAQATLRTDGLGVPAKGLTGRGYDGHYFWDVEVYVQPFLTYVYPEISRRLIEFRYRMLPAARRQARVVGERGALFPWRTINGVEASGNYLTSTAQYHINADIVHALRHYVQVTGDRSVLADVGAEILVETARLWAHLGFYASDGQFHIHGVTGPDEYSALVDDSVYTNLMAQENLRYAASVVDKLRQEQGHVYEELARRVTLQDEEPAQWLWAAERMYVPYDAQRGIHPQDVGFLQQEPWDFAGTPADRYPLLLHYHPLVLYRYQVVKQADVILAMLLVGDRFTAGQRRANFHYYERITTGDSSLSHAIQSIMAAEVGDRALAQMHFQHALFLDLTDWAGNADDGVHIASTGGVWMALVYGVAGMRDYGGELTFDPRLPAEWTRLSFALRVRGQSLAVTLSPASITLRLQQGEGLDVRVRAERVQVRPGLATTVRLEEGAGTPHQA